MRKVKVDIKVVLVDDHVVVRSGFAQLLNLEEDLIVEGQFSSAAEAWPALSRDDVDVAVMDIAMPDENGLSLLKRLRTQRPSFAPSFSAFTTPRPAERLRCGRQRLSDQALRPGGAGAGGARRRHGRALPVRRCAVQRCAARADAKCWRRSPARARSV
jgi:CheY-like chemotaxis protein